MIFVGGRLHGQDVLVDDDLEVYVDLVSSTRYHRRVPYFNTTESKYRQQVFVHESLDTFSQSEGLKVLTEAVLRWWFSLGEQVAEEPETEPLYVARCETCDPPLDMPFSETAKRATWAREHNEATGHHIKLREEPRQ